MNSGLKLYDECFLLAAGYIFECKFELILEKDQF